MKTPNRLVLLALVPAVAWGFLSWGFWSVRETPTRPPAPHWMVDEPERLVLRSPAGFQTVTRRDGQNTGLYYDSGMLVGQLRPQARTVALLGLGGGEMLRAAWRSLPEPELKRRLIGVELDAKTAELAVSEFHVNELGVEVVVADALDWIVLQPKGSLSVVMVDVYADSVLPEPFRRLAFFIDCARALEPKGLLLMNVWPRALVPEVRKNLEVLFAVTERRYGENTVLVAELR